MMVMQIPSLRARDQLQAMDAAVYGNRIHAGREAQMSYDVTRARLERIAYPDG